MYVQQRIQRPCEENLKLHQKKLSTITGNATAAFSASLLSAFAGLSNHFFKTPSYFGGEPPVPPPTP